MGDAGLDPRAEEFRPCYPTYPQFYLPYPAPPYLAHVSIPNPAHVSGSPPPAYFCGSRPDYFSTSPPAHVSNPSPAHVSGGPYPAAHFSGTTEAFYLGSSGPAHVSVGPAHFSGPADAYFSNPGRPAHVSGYSPAHFSGNLSPARFSGPVEAYPRNPNPAHVSRFPSPPAQVGSYSSPSAHVSGSGGYPAHVSGPGEGVATRTIVVGSVARGVSETEVRRELEAFGDVRAVQMERLRREGTVTVHFYDIRHATEAAREICARGQLYGAQLVRGAVWAKFVSPNMAGLPDGYNQGTLVVFNLNPRFSNENLKELFEPFGEVKELRETPMKRYQRFIEFYDIRNAAKAYSQLNGKEICGNQIVIEFSRPGGYKKHLQKNISKNPNTRFSNPPKCENSCNSQSRKPSSQGSSNGSERCFQKQKSKKEKQTSNQKPMNKSKGWSCKGRQPRCLDSRFLINEDGIVDSSVTDLRTTVMIKNIPNKYSQKLLLNMLDNHCIHCNEEIANSGRDEPLSSYDFVYLPIDFINKCNVGYGFVNMTSPVAALRLYKSFHHQTWEVYNSKKICEVTYARLQGLEALKEHFRNSKFPCAAEAYLPVVFSPPRDGRQLTDPIPVAARSPSLSLSSKEDTNTNSSQQTLTDGNSNGNSDTGNSDGCDGDSSGELSQ